MSKLITPIFRGSFVQVMKPKSFSPDQDPKYSIVIPIPTDDKFVEEMNKTIEQVCIDKWGEVPKKFKLSIKNGDDEEEKYGWAGMTVYTASNKSAPGVVIKTEQGLVPPMTDEDIYSGAFYRASIRPYAYEYQKSKGVAISLDNLMKIKDGEKFTSRTKAEDDFAAYAEGDWE